jgi:hypothetical protein
VTRGLVSASWAVLVAAGAQARDAIRCEGVIVGVASTYDTCNHPRAERTRDRVKGLYD